MRRAVLVTLVVVSTALSVVMGPAAPASEAPEPVRSSERSLRESIAAARSAEGLRRLRLDEDLVRAARRNSRKMASAGTLLHTNIDALLDRYVIAGENVGRDDTALQVHRMFMSSDYHRGNILRRRYRRIGVGAIRAGDDLYVTEVFAGRRTD